MENSNSNSGEELRRPEIIESTSRTLTEVVDEIQEIINHTHWLETRLAKLEAIGFQIEHCWIKNGSLATIWYMKRKKVFRIQVSESELIGDYHKAYCAIISMNEISIQESDISKVRNYSNNE